MKNVKSHKKEKELGHFTQETVEKGELENYVQTYQTTNHYFQTEGRQRLLIM